MFSPYVSEQLRFYVYTLVDPRDSSVFYIGKGRGNRVFDHAADALTNTVASDKLDRIRDIRAAGEQVSTQLVRIGLSEQEAYEVEAALIQWVGLDDLTNIVAGHDVRERGQMSTDDAIALFEAPPIDPDWIDVPIVLLKIPKLWFPGMSTEELLDTTSGWWKLGPRREKARYAAAVSAGVVRGVFRIDRWRQRQKGDRDWEQDIGKAPRWGFEGVDAPELRHLRNRSVRHWYKKGEAGVARYVNC